MSKGEGRRQRRERGRRRGEREEREKKEGVEERERWGGWYSREGTCLTGGGSPALDRVP